MALIKCPECGNDVSSASKNCIKCGFPIEDFMNQQMAQQNNQFNNQQPQQPFQQQPNEYMECFNCHQMIRVGVNYCPFCKAVYNSNFTTPNVNNNQAPIPAQKTQGISVAAIILTVLALFFSILAMPAGLLFAFIGFIVCIVGLCTKSAVKKAAFIVCLVLSMLAIPIYAMSVLDESESSSSDNIDEYYSSVLEKESESAVIPKDEPIKVDEPTEIIEEISEEEYKASCTEYSYKDVLRNPENYIGEHVKVEIEIGSVHESSLLNANKYYFGNSKDETYDQYWGDTYGVYDFRNEADESWFKILEDDVIVVYGEIADTEQTSSLILNSEELFVINMKYAELVSE